MDRRAVGVRERALRVLGDDDGRFELRLDAVIVAAGCQAHTLGALSVAQLEDVDKVLDRIAAGTHIPFLRTTGAFEIRRVAVARDRKGRRR